VTVAAPSCCQCARHLCASLCGSTITQPLVKDVHLGGSDGGVNKLADWT
jgi:hypothetical protein